MKRVVVQYLILLPSGARFSLDFLHILSHMSQIQRPPAWRQIPRSGNTTSLCLDCSLGDFYCCVCFISFLGCAVCQWVSAFIPCILGSCSSAYACLSAVTRCPLLRFSSGLRCFFSFCFCFCISRNFPLCCKSLNSYLSFFLIFLEHLSDVLHSFRLECLSLTEEAC